MPIIWAAEVEALRDGGGAGEVAVSGVSGLMGGAAGEVAFGAAGEAMAGGAPGGVVSEAGEVRQARFGALPERVAFEDMIAEQPAGPANQAVDAYDPDGVGVRFSCLAADLGL